MSARAGPPEKWLHSSAGMMSPINYQNTAAPSGKPHRQASTIRGEPHLRDRVHSGSECRYETDPDHPVRWVVDARTR